MAKVQLTEENRKIQEKLKWDFKNDKIDSNNFNRDIVSLVSEMVAQGIQLSQQDNEEN